MPNLRLKENVPDLKKTNVYSPSSAAMVGTGKPKIFENISLIFDTNGPTSS